MNWGMKLTIGMGLFMGFIITLVTFMIINHEKDSLIESDYYEKGQTYDLDYKAKQDAIDDKVVPEIKATKKGAFITFPIPVNYTITFRRLSDANMDKTFKSNSQKTEIFIPESDLRSGSWLLRIRYNTNDKTYLYQDKILIP